MNECENLLRSHYNLYENDSLIIFKIEIHEEGFKILITEYEIYNLRIKQKLDTSICNQTKIKMIYPVSINESEIFKYNPTDKYYNDICYHSTTNYGTDITTKDRRKEYLDNNMSLCESNCDFDKYDSKNKKVECNCQIKLKIPLMNNVIINKNLLMNKFTDIDNEINLSVMKCYKLLFRNNFFIINIGFYIMLFIVLVSIICLIAFITKGYKKISEIVILIQY